MAERKNSSTGNCNHFTQEHTHSHLIFLNIQQRHATLNLSPYFFQMLHLNLLCDGKLKILHCNKNLKEEEEEKLPE